MTSISLSSCEFEKICICFSLRFWRSCGHSRLYDETGTGYAFREIQRDWYGKRGISLDGFYVIAQVAVGERRIDVLDLWCEDTKQDALLTQSTVNVGFAWMEKVFPNFQVYLFSGEYVEIKYYWCLELFIISL